jgi:hypothetical protein
VAGEGNIAPRPNECRDTNHATCHAAALLAASPLGAQELRLGVSSEITSADPHFQSASPDNALWRHVYKPLVDLSDTSESVPVLAASWRLVSPTEWELWWRGVVCSPTRTIEAAILLPFADNGEDHLLEATDLRNRKR